MMAYMRRPGFQNGTIVPPPKPEQKTPFIDKLKNLKEVAPGLMPRSKVSILKMYMDEALKDGEITKEQHTEMLMPYFGELGEKVTEQIEVSDRDNFAIGGGAIEGQDLGSREGFAGPQLIKSGVDKNKYTYGIRNPEYEGPGKGQSPTIKQGPFDTLEEAQKSFDTRQKKMGELKLSGRNKAVTDKAQEINNFVNDFYDQNINKYDLRDYNSFKKAMLDAFEKSEIKSGSGRKAILEGYPNIGNIDSKVPFEKYGVGDLLRTKGSSGTSKPTDTFFKKLFYSGKIETDPILKKRVNDYLEYYNVDKKFYGDGAPIDRQALKKKYADTLNNLDDTLFLIGDDSIGTGKTRANILRKYFPDKVDTFIAKRSSTGELYKKNVASVENFLTEKQLKEALDGHTSIKKFMTSQTDQLKKIFDLSQLSPSLVFNADHVEGMTEIAKLDNPEDIIRGLKNLVGMTKQRNLNLGWGGYSQKRRDLTDKINQGINPQKNLDKLNKLTQESYPSELKNKKAYSLKNGVLTPTQDFNFISDPETRFKQYFTELTSTPEGLKALKLQYKDNPKLQEIVQTDPNLTSAIDNTYNKMIEVLKNPKFKNVLQNSGLTLRGLGQMRKGNIPGFLNTMEKLTQKNPDFKVELGDPYKDIENQYAALDTGTMSDVSLVKKETEEPGLPAEAIGAGTLFGMKYAPQIAKGVGIITKAVGSPLAGLTLAGTELLSDDPSLGQAGAEIIFTDQIRRAAGQVPKGIMSNVFGLQGLSKFGKLGTALATRIPRAMTPVGLTMLGAEGIKKLYDEEQKKNRMIEAMDPEEKLQFLEEEKATEEFISRSSAAYGGRMGFADGPEDPKKRKFMKIMGGLASIPLLGRFIDIGIQAPKVAEVLRRGADGMPDFIYDLIAKVKLKAAEKGTKYFTGNRADEFADVYQADNYVVTEKGNKITIREVDQDGDMLYKENQMEIDLDPETGGVTYNEASAKPDMEGKLKDVEEYIETDDLENMRKYTYDE